MRCHKGGIVDSLTEQHEHVATINGNIKLNKRWSGGVVEVTGDILWSSEGKIGVATCVSHRIPCKEEEGGQIVGCHEGVLLDGIHVIIMNGDLHCQVVDLSDIAARGEVESVLRGDAITSDQLHLFHHHCGCINDIIPHDQQVLPVYIENETDVRWRVDVGENFQCLHCHFVGYWHHWVAHIVCSRATCEGQEGT